MTPDAMSSRLSFELQGEGTKTNVMGRGFMGDPKAASPAGGARRR